MCLFVLSVIRRLSPTFYHAHVSHFFCLEWRRDLRDLRILFQMLEKTGVCFYCQWSEFIESVHFLRIDFRDGRDKWSGPDDEDDP